MPAISQSGELSPRRIPLQGILEIVQNGLAATEPDRDFESTTEFSLTDAQMRIHGYGQQRAHKFDRRELVLCSIAERTL